jgi:hypothetical protein
LRAPASLTQVRTERCVAAAAPRRSILELLADTEATLEKPLAMLHDGPSSLQQAMCYAADARSLWAKHPAAVATLLPLRAVTHTKHYLDGQIELPSVAAALHYIAQIPDVSPPTPALRAYLAESTQGTREVRG